MAEALILEFTGVDAAAYAAVNAGCRCSLTTRAGPEPGGDLLVSPADRRSVGRPFNHCRDLLGRSYFRDCHEADTHHCIEVVAVRPLS